MAVLGDLISGAGVILFIIGAGYWLWFGYQKNKLALIRSRSPWHLLGNLTVIGMLVFVLGRMLADSR